MTSGIIKETKNYQVIVNKDKVHDFIYNIVNKDTQVVESKGFCLPLILSDILTFQSLLDRVTAQPLSEKEYDTLEKLSV